MEPMRGWLSCIANAQPLEGEVGLFRQYLLQTEVAGRGVGVLRKGDGVGAVGKVSWRRKGLP